jgi:hypothetical protein
MCYAVEDRDYASEDGSVAGVVEIHVLVKDPKVVNGEWGALFSFGGFGGELGGAFKDGVQFVWADLPGLDAGGIVGNGCA